mmetsp:Transcript_75809/g.190689  ORF Transcript_75809/g.190689 Transcript_75809/m.190689 type:complete len:213 (+) Transcript_75809:1542-2180(+)
MPTKGTATRSDFSNCISKYPVGVDACISADAAARFTAAVAWLCTAFAVLVSFILKDSAANRWPSRLALRSAARSPALSKARSPICSSARAPAVCTACPLVFSRERCKARSPARSSACSPMRSNVVLPALSIKRSPTPATPWNARSRTCNIARSPKRSKAASPARSTTRSLARSNARSPPFCPRRSKALSSARSLARSTARSPALSKEPELTR